ncbi:polysaccharide deacetylase family protein [Paenibacillus flagellatus]|uniref:Polysaccharide deacetylase family protein n=2 Tax=Paenibacillus flagellatus TaxID=2211139 RepID=A0A2V5JXU9_9BACL|nr:polysaccharide deacetylase family protein [Paenibacillus flagellatus]
MTAVADEIHAGTDPASPGPNVVTAEGAAKPGLPGSAPPPVHADAGKPAGRPDASPGPATGPVPGTPAKPDNVPHPTAAKRVALTFDDGPDKKYTPQILDILKKREVKATFFVVGLQVEKCADVLKRIVEEGHAVGNHTYDHANLTERTAAEIAEEIRQTDEAIRKALGTGTDLFRPPYGATNDVVKKTVADSKQELVQWTVDTRDWAGTTPDEIMEKVKSQTKPDGIILMHCFGGKNGKLDNTVEALPRVIDYLKDEGYTFVTVPELLAAEAETREQKKAQGNGHGHGQGQVQAQAPRSEAQVQA